MSLRVARIVVLLIMASSCRCERPGGAATSAASVPDSAVPPPSNAPRTPAAKPALSEPEAWALARACGRRGFEPFESPIAVVRDCERAVGLAADAERPERLLGLGRLYARLETTLCGACGYRAGRGDDCDAFLPFARGMPGAFVKRTGRPGYAYNGRELLAALERSPAHVSANARTELDELSTREKEMPDPGCRELERQALFDACPPSLRHVPDPFDALWGCEAKAALADPADLPLLLLTQGRLHAQLPRELRASYVHCDPGCGPLQGYANSHPDQYGPVVLDANAPPSYTGWHFKELQRRFPGHPLAADARCDLIRLKSGAKGWAAPECLAVIAREGPGPCPASFPAGGDPIKIVAACESSARRAPEPEQPPLLLAVGRLFRDLPETCREGGCKGSVRLQFLRNDLFDYDELGDDHHYSGKHFEELVRRWPERPEADHAAWDLARLHRGGECESFIDCELSHYVGYLSKYAARFPRGLHAEEAVAQAKTALAKYLRQLEQGGAWDGDMGPRVLESVEETALRLADDHRAALFEAVAPWWDRIGDYGRAGNARARAREAAGKE